MPEITAYYRYLWAVPNPLRGLLTRYPQIGFHSICNTQYCDFECLAFDISYVVTHPFLLRLPCEQFRTAKFLRDWFEQTDQPCESHCAELDFSFSIKYLSQHTGPVFAFKTTSGFEPEVF